MRSTLSISPDLEIFFPKDWTDDMIMIYLDNRGFFGPDRPRMMPQTEEQRESNVVGFVFDKINPERFKKTGMEPEFLMANAMIYGCAPQEVQGVEINMPRPPVDFSQN